MPLRKNPTKEHTETLTAFDSLRRKNFLLLGSKKYSSRRSFFALWLYWLPPALLALVLAYELQSPFAGEWDSMDYMTYSVNGFTPSSMLLGRMGFLFSNRLVFLACHEWFGVTGTDAYVLFKNLVIAQTPLAIIALWVLTRMLTHSARAATLGAFMLTLVPYFLFTGGQVMTEVPSILFMCVALSLHVLGLRKKTRGEVRNNATERSTGTRLVILSAVLLGFAVNIREGAALFAPWLVLSPFFYGWKWNKRDIGVTVLACLLFLLVALGPFALWFQIDPILRGRWLGWLEGSQRETILHPVSIENLPRFLQLCQRTAPLVFLLSPLALLLSAWRARTLGMSPVFLMGGVGAFATLSLYSHYSMVIHGRYFLTGLPGLIPLVAFYMYRFHRKGRKFRNLRILRILAKSRVQFAIALLIVLSIGATSILRRLPEHYSNLTMHYIWKKYLKKLRTLPAKDSVVMASSMAVSTNYWRNVGAGQWESIGYGCGWPGNDKIINVIQDHLKNGKRVFIDLTPGFWPIRGWQSQETASLPSLASAFRFRKVQTIPKDMYEICPQSDLSASDHPNLHLIPTK